MRKRDVLARFGGPINTAKTLGITRSAVAQWKALVPERIAWRVQHLTDGALTVNPSLYAPKSRLPSS
jgi:hypothetical protein